MQSEIQSQHPELDFQILGVNGLGAESGNESMYEDKTLPLLQDIDDDADGESDVWVNMWDVEWRDVFILNQDNQRIGVVNLSEYNLADTANFQALQNILVATAEDRPLWQNANNPLDVNNDGLVTGVGDVLSCINEINRPQVRDVQFALPLPMPPIQQEFFYDINGDGLVTGVGDVLPVINHINGVPTDAEGEAAEGEASLWQSLLPEAELSSGGLDSTESNAAPADESAKDANPPVLVTPATVDADSQRQPASAEVLDAAAVTPLDDDLLELLALDAGLISG